VRTLAGDAAWLPLFYDARSDAFVFAHAPRELQRRLVFLDPRFLAEAPASAPIPARDLTEAARAAAKPIHFIFHTAFCCSTLLARALDLPGVSMGLKEPSILVDLSHPMVAQQRTDGVDPLGIAIDLLSRPFEVGETQVVKPSNAANALAGAILDRRAQAKALVLYSNLDAYLLSSARIGPAGRHFNRQMFAKLAQIIPLQQRFTAQELLAQSDLQIAAQVWLMQVSLLDAVAKHHGPSRVRTLNSATLLADKVASLSRLGGFFGLTASAAQWADVASGPVFARDAKSPDGAPFDPDAKAAADAIHAGEVSAVMPWALDLAAQCGVSLDLGDTLMA
jgi:hypothetical protein